MSPTLPLISSVNITTTGTTSGTYFYGGNNYTTNSNDFYALAPLAHGTNCSGGPTGSAPCPYVQLYGLNPNSLQTGTTSVGLLDLVFATNLPSTGGTVSILTDPQSPIDGPLPGTTCVQLIQCTNELEFVGPAEGIPPAGAAIEYRGLLDPASGPYLVGNVVPLPGALWLLASGVAGLGLIGRRREQKLRV